MLHKSTRPLFSQLTITSEFKNKRRYSVVTPIVNPVSIINNKKKKKTKNQKYNLWEVSDWNSDRAREIVASGVARI